jgi:hypothetical protein
MMHRPTNYSRQHDAYTGLPVTLKTFRLSRDNLTPARIMSLLRTGNVRSLLATESSIEAAHRSRSWTRRR